MTTCFLWKAGAESIDLGGVELPTDLTQGGVLPLLLQQQEPAIQQGSGLLIDPQVTLGAVKVVVGGGVGVFFALVDPAGGDAVAEHLRYIFFRHFAAAHGHGAVGADAVVDPVLEVMAVAALVVQPGQAHAGFAALLVVGAAKALVILGAAPELRGAVLAQVMGEALPIQAQTKAVVPHQAAVASDGFQMFPNVHFPDLHRKDASSIAQFTQKGQGDAGEIKNYRC